MGPEEKRGWELALSRSIGDFVGFAMVMNRNGYTLRVIRTREDGSQSELVFDPDDGNATMLLCMDKDTPRDAG
jgi:hypothetical protein